MGKAPKGKKGRHLFQKRGVPKKHGEQYVGKEEECSNEKKRNLIWGEEQPEREFFGKYAGAFF